MLFYKFRSLRRKKDFNRVKKVLKTGKFWCSNFMDLNDPMEGLFLAERGLSNKIRDGKKEYKICSFSHETAFSEPIMWCYYADGFMGLAIAVEIKEEELKEVTYDSRVPTIKSMENFNEDIEDILTQKFSAWEHEKEYRFLKQSEMDKSECEYKIGKIKSIYFGNPYGSHECSSEIEKSTFKIYKERKEQLIQVAKKKNIECFNVDFVNGKAIKGKKIPD